MDCKPDIMGIAVPHPLSYPLTNGSFGCKDASRSISSGKRCGQHPPPPCDNNSKSTENDGNNTSGCSHKGVMCVHREKRHAGKQCITEAQTAMSMEVHRRHGLKGGNAIPQPRIIERT